MSDPRNEPSFNPYAAPHANNVTDGYGNGNGNGDTQPVRLFSARGRMGRLRYICWAMAFGTAAVLLSFIVLIAAMGTAILNIHSRADLVQALIGTGGAAIGLVAIIAIVWFVMTILLLIQRSHDMGWSGWSVLLLFAILVVGFVLGTLLSHTSLALGSAVMSVFNLVVYIWYIKPGTPDANRFGPPPSPTPLVIQIFAWIFVAFIALGFISSVVRLLRLFART